MLRGNKTFYLACLSVLLLGACAKKDPPAFERPPSPVTVATAVAQDVPLYLDEVGQTVAREVVSVQPEVSGRITEIHFTDGADLKKGDPALYDRSAALSGAARLGAGQPGAIQGGAGLRQDSVCARAGPGGIKGDRAAGLRHAEKRRGRGRGAGQAERSRGRIRAPEPGIHLDPFADRRPRRAPAGGHRKRRDGQQHARC